MSDPKDNDKPSLIHYEGGIPILDTRLNEIERKQAEAESRDKNYKDDQIAINRRLVHATSALVIATIVMGAAGGIQLWYMHRQWKLTSDGLSKMGDQIWAEKKASDASTRSADTAKGELLQMTEQSEDDQRAWVGVQDTVKIMQVNPTQPSLPVKTAIMLINSGKTPAINLKRVSAYMISTTLKPGPEQEYIRMIEEKLRNTKDHIALGPGATHTLESSDNGNYINPKWGKILAKTDFLYLYGIFEYQDIAKRNHRTTFCFYLKDPAAQQFASCESYNDMN